MKTFFVGVKAVIKEERGVLLLFQENSRWDTPGGRIDGDETFEQAMRRELSEEIPGVRLKNIINLVGAVRLHRDIDKDIDLVRLFYLVEADIPEKITLSSEHSDFMWAKTPEDLPKDSLQTEVRDILTAVFANQT